MESQDLKIGLKIKYQVTNLFLFFIPLVVEIKTSKWKKKIIVGEIEKFVLNGKGGLLD